MKPKRLCAVFASFTAKRKSEQNSYKQKISLKIIFLSSRPSQFISKRIPLSTILKLTI